MASIVKCAGGWRVQIAIKGKRKSGTYATKAQAQAWAAMRETEIRTEAATGMVIGKTCRDAFERYEKEVSRTKRGFRWEALRLSGMTKAVVGKAVFGDVKLNELTAPTAPSMPHRRACVDLGRLVRPFYRPELLPWYEKDFS
ncbi:hypothetical protein [Collimonas humicola]|uniref:hypothetical protein n=1 Tax=Collimonas humicola TaxID=2825886 RepID=UPI001B8B6D28|nr:hypothetical protein [Collimonas humicola]